MTPPLHLFIREFVGVVVMAVVPVVLLAFLSIPLSLAGHPGDTRTTDALTVRHMT